MSAKKKIEELNNAWHELTSHGAPFEVEKQA